MRGLAPALYCNNSFDLKLFALTTHKFTPKTAGWFGWLAIIIRTKPINWKLTRPSALI